ncbi:hypothetical protein J6590_007144 [Homalodisca vitripennis]|nr:hypothetical protein J6590_007144 [Homalodisca vitripennis]
MQLCTGRVPCMDDCDQPRHPVCALDIRHGSRVFDSICLLESWNLCYKTDYQIQPELSDCLQTYDEEYSREGKVPYKNPQIIHMYGRNKVDPLYL